MGVCDLPSVVVGGASELLHGRRVFGAALAVVLVAACLSTSYAGRGLPMSWNGSYCSFINNIERISAQNPNSSNSPSLPPSRFFFHPSFAEALILSLDINPLSFILHPNISK